MQTNQPIKLTINHNQFGFENNHRQIIEWLMNKMPAILKEQPAPTEIKYLKSIHSINSLCLN